MDVSDKVAPDSTLAADPSASSITVSRRGREPVSFLVFSASLR